MKIIFNPFSRLSTNVLLITGMLLTIAGGFLAYYFNARFDGALDFHFVEDVAVQTTLAELLIDIACLGIALFVAAKQINTKTRHIDIFCTVLVSRLPLYLLAPLNANGKMYAILETLLAMKDHNPMTLNPGDLLMLLLLAIVTLLFTVWLFVLLWNGFKVACNAKGNRPVFFFIGAIVLAEIISKILIIYTL